MFAILHDAGNSGLLTEEWNANCDAAEVC